MRLKWKKEPLSTTDRILATNGAHMPPARWMLQDEAGVCRATVARGPAGFEWMVLTDAPAPRGRASTVERAKELAKAAVRA